MPRHMRDLGKTGWEHIILRGINRENLFYDAEDYERFASTLARFQKAYPFEIAVSCLMCNHVHLLMFVEDGTHAQIIKRITVSYASYYNKKYDRVGHVFQDRFRSEPINDERYLLTVARYIYLNPQKASVCAAKEYPYTYIQKDGILSGYFSSPAELDDFLSTENSDRCLEFDSTAILDDSEAIELIVAISGNQNPQSIQGLDRASRDEVIQKMKAAGLTVRQVSRLTGINRNIVQRAQSKNESKRTVPNDSLTFEYLKVGDEAALREMSALATAILREYYDPLLGTAQNDYMLEKFQSVPAIREQLDHGYQYYFLCEGGRHAGFTAFYPREDCLYLSKLYLCADARGKGYGRETLAFLEAKALEAGLHAIELNVNKYNATVRIYEALGFERVRAEKNDIGAGYYMDDFVYRLTF